VKNARKKKLEDYLIYEEDFLHLEEPVFAVPYWLRNAFLPV